MEIISSIQEEILKEFGKIPDSGQFYLTGGTALAHFYLRHRKSNDLDFFTSEEGIILPFTTNLEKFLAGKNMGIERRRGMHSFVELSIRKNDESTLIHIAQDAPFRFEPTVNVPEYPNLRIDSLIDIASNKLLALFARATLRDFLDIYFLVKEKGFSIDKLMELAKDKDPGFDLYWLGVALERINLFKADSPEMLLLLSPCNFKELTAFFNDWREQIAKTL